MTMIKLQIQKGVSGEYRVAVYLDGIRSESATYYTDDKDDAIKTLEIMRTEFDGDLVISSTKIRNVNF